MKSSSSHLLLATFLPFFGMMSLMCAKDPVEAGERRIEHRDVITGLDTPWEIVWGPDNWLWVTERGGRVSRVNPESGEQVILTTIADVHQTGEAGLLGMAVHRAGSLTSVFVVYTYEDADDDLLKERLVRYEYDGTTLINPQELISGIPANSNHNGSRLLIIGDKLFMTTGDAQNSSEAQKHGSISGKVLRMNLDGTPPGDNPWAGASHPANLIWTTGHRNAQGLAVGPNGILYSSEHGPNSDDELNIIEKGRNYGWPEVNGFCEGGESGFCADSNVAEPIKAWTPTTAVCGLAFYNHDLIPGWRNSLLLANLKAQDLRVLRLGSDGRSIAEEEVFSNEAWGRLRAVCVAPDGRVFLGTSNRDGRGSPKDGDDRIVELNASSINGN